MKPVQTAYIVLGATIPVALILLWWAYRKRQKDALTGKSTDEQETVINEPQISRLSDAEETSCENETSLITTIQESEEEVSLLASNASARSLDESKSGLGEEQKENKDGKSKPLLPETPPADNNNEDSASNLTNRKVVIVPLPPELETTGEVSLTKETLQGTADTSVEVGQETKEEGTSNTQSWSEAPSAESHQGSGDAPEKLSQSIDTTESIKESEVSSQQFSEEFSEIQTDKSTDDSDATQLLNMAIADSIQMNMSLPVTEMESSEQDADSHNEDFTKLSPEEPPQMVPLEKEVGDATQEEVQDDTQNEDHKRASTEMEECTGNGSTVSDLMSTTEITEEKSESSVFEEHYLEESKESFTPSSLSSVDSQNDNDSSHTESITAPEKETSGTVENETEEEAKKLENGEKTEQEQEAVPNTNNNNSADSTNKTECSQTLNENNAGSNDTQELNTNSLDKEKNSTINGHVHEEDAKLLNGTDDTYHNGNGLMNHDPRVLNGPMNKNLESETQVYLEFPSDKVGLLIGKLGRNIKQLKQESGAEIMVHTVPFRDDVQVLQIIGMASSVDLAVSKIQGRFREVTLTEFDARNVMGLNSPSALVSPTGSPVSPPNFAYPIPEISQLRLPEGIPVEVIVSAIADCDAIFLQQYTHPTFHALASLEQAMSLCYSSGSTPSLLSPVQVGLVCVAQHQDIWYRAQVVHASEDSSEVTIRFVDYGGYSTIPTSTVKQIRADFITLPFQAAECYLDNIAPPEGEESYSTDSTKVLQDILMEGDFHARITGYRPDGHPLIRLYKRHDSMTELVNELLVEKGVARWMDPIQDPTGLSAT